MDWDKLKIFHAVAEAGSFTNATINLNLSQSAISRQIQSLEQDLKVQLFERHARGLTLTENGEYLFKTAHDVISKLKEVESTLGDQKNKPTGKLTITTVRSFGTHWLTPRIQEFMTLNPEIEIELNEDKLRNTGLSHQKVSYCRNIAKAIIEETLNFDELEKMEDKEVIQTLVKIKGIGEWTAQCYLMACMKRLDAWPASDLGLIVAIQKIKGMKERPKSLTMSSYQLRKLLSMSNVFKKANSRCCYSVRGDTTVKALNLRLSRMSENSSRTS